MCLQERRPGAQEPPGQHERDAEGAGGSLLRGLYGGDDDVMLMLMFMLMLMLMMMTIVMMMMMILMMVMMMMMMMMMMTQCNRGCPKSALLLID